MTARSGFVNRRGELSALADDAATVSRGESRVVQLSGPAGIGKTALVSTFLNAHPVLTPVLVAGAPKEKL